MTALAESLATLAGRLGEITAAVGKTTQAAQKPITQSTETQATQTPKTDSQAAVIEKQVRITLELPKSGKTETIVTDESGEAALSRFLQGLQSDLERL